ncbi:MAG: histidine phosphatase family protein [Candidatus Saganbacteria bacterium]|nr:histidine phosphatase family protein [Candidatus Saganbacteria bacterium]
MLVSLIRNPRFRTLAEVIKNIPEIEKRGTCLCIIARHGETDRSKKNLPSAGFDILLNDKGKDQSTRLSKYLKPVPFERIYTSPSSRALFLAEALSNEKENIKIIKCADLSEMNQPEETKNYWDVFRYKHMPHRFKAPPPYEDFQGLKQREEKKIIKIVEDNIGKVVIIAGHMLINNSILMSAFGIHLSQFWDIPLQHPAFFDVIEFDRTMKNNSLWLFHHSIEG